MNKSIVSSLILAIAGGLSGCATLPKGASAVTPFQKERYLGKWFEVARFDFSFEKNLNQTSAEYVALENGKISVTNRGYDTVKNRWKEAHGSAKFRGSDTVAELKVSFFGPFYGAYNVIALDPDYKYALVAGSSTEYLWILSREKTIPDSIKTRYLDLAKSIGYDLSKLIWVKHDQ